MVIAYGGKHQPRGFVLLGAYISPSNRQGHVRALSVYAASVECHLNVCDRPARIIGKDDSPFVANDGESRDRFGFDGWCLFHV
jgi:hypothetical protein